MKNNKNSVKHIMHCKNKLLFLKNLLYQRPEFRF